jgi:hypothetical protein
MPPPEKESARSLAGRAQSASEWSANSDALPAITQVWTTEARRLAGEFSLTGDWRHFTALVRHVAGMSWRMNRSRLQRAVIRRLLERSTAA